MSKTFRWTLAVILILAATGFVASHTLASSSEAEEPSGDASSVDREELTPELRESLEALLEQAEGEMRWRNLEDPAPRHNGMCLAGSTDLCDVGARIVHTRPCLAGAEDCPAYDSWQQVMGEPGIRHAPEIAVHAAKWQPSTEPVPAEPESVKED